MFPINNPTHLLGFCKNKLQGQTAQQTKGAAPHIGLEECLSQRDKTKNKILLQVECIKSKSTYSMLQDDLYCYCVLCFCQNLIYIYSFVWFIVMHNRGKQIITLKIKLIISFETLHTFAIYIMIGKNTRPIINIIWPSPTNVPTVNFLHCCVFLNLTTTKKHILETDVFLGVKSEFSKKLLSTGVK